MCTGISSDRLSAAMSRSQRSLVKGSPAPGPVPEGLIRLYSMRFCPYAQRPLLVLAAKGIKHEVVNINLKSKPDWFFEKSPLGLVPSLETPDGKIIHDSPIICDYLDEAYPGNKLTPADPYEKAEEKMLLEHFSTVISTLYKIFFAKKDNQNTTEVKEQFFEKLKKLEEVFGENATYQCLVQAHAAGPRCQRDVYRAGCSPRLLQAVFSEQCRCG
ncbi:glutathione S-transferase omega-1-like isoform X3 [Eleutherodactylus coqui]|uniref:glutathione S-transferase omega-1-like isoform X3 n=1 Tax=Eleutherodactylus coqui TaxID=57060 RepID=UPI0034632321